MSDSAANECPKYGGKVCRPEAGALCECGANRSAAQGRHTSVMDKIEVRDCASGSRHTGHMWMWDGCRMWCNGRAA